MDLELIAWGYPFFVLLIVAEVVYSARKRLGLYRFADAITDLACGLGSQTVGLFLAFVAVGIYVWAYQFRVATLPDDSPWVWVAALLLVDFVFYWWHRLSHQVHFLWAGHVVHHQSEDYNLAVALRQEWLTHLTHIPFFLPMALLGFSWKMLALHVSISLLYQFWIHTEVIRRMGPYEWIFNAPMHHRVHHAINPQYLDKNYGGIFIFWDKLFGTFEAEVEPCVYGTTTPIASWNSFWANWIVWDTMASAARQTAKWSDKLRVWWKSPAWSPPDLPAHPPHAVDRTTVRKYDTPTPNRLKLWLSVQLLLATGVQMLLQKASPLLIAGNTPLYALALLLILWSLLNLGGLLEQKPWAKTSEALRLVLMIAACAVGSTRATDGAFAWMLLVAIPFVVLLLTLPLATSRQTSA
jgi:sterol desaturase/sphingolipid hydroxylase (fatty acid hydroxylase superfamily)